MQIWLLVTWANTLYCTDPLALHAYRCKQRGFACWLNCNTSSSNGSTFMSVILLSPWCWSYCVWTVTTWCWSYCDHLVLVLLCLNCDHLVLVLLCLNCDHLHKRPMKTNRHTQFPSLYWPVHSSDFIQLSSCTWHNHNRCALFMPTQCCLC